MRMPSRLRCGSRPSTPAAVVDNPFSRALASPSEASSIPTIHFGSIQALRSALYIRSVPIFPEPTRAALIFSMALSPAASDEEFLHGLTHVERAQGGADDGRVVGDVGARGVDVEPVAHHRAVHVDRAPAQERHQLIAQRAAAAPY